MKTYGVTISEAAIRAGLSAMTGSFTKNDIATVLVRHGTPSGCFVADRTADKLLQRERKAGRIEAVTNKVWRRCPYPDRGGQP